MYVTKVQISKKGLRDRSYKKAMLALYLHEHDSAHIAHISIHLSKEHALIYKQVNFPKDPQHPVEPKCIFIKIQLEQSLHEQLKKSDAGIFYTGDASILNKIREKKIRRIAA